MATIDFDASCAPVEFSFSSERDQDDIESIYSVPHDLSNHRDEEESERNLMASKETTVISVLRVVMILVMIAAGTLVSLGIFYFTSNNSLRAFQIEFEGLSRKVLESTPAKLAHRLDGLDALAVDLNLHARARDQRWPFVTNPDFEVLAGKVRQTSDFDSIMILPLVDGTTKAAWQNYSLQNQDWIIRSIAETEVEGLKVDGTIMPYIYDGNSSLQTSGEGPFLPTWQISPPIPQASFYNYNTLSSNIFGTSLERVLSLQKAGFSSVIPQTGNDVLGVLSLPDQDPLIAILVPLFDGIGSSVDLVGVLIATLRLGSILEGAVAGSEAVVCELANSAGQSYAFMVDSSKTELLSDVASYPTKEASIFREIDLTEALHSYQSQERPDVVEINTSFLQYTFTVYPSTSSPNNSNAPIYATIVALVFVFTIMLFITYDCVVQRRQKEVVMAALRSTKLVASLFPARVRERLLQQPAPPKPYSETIDMCESEEPCDATDSDSTCPNKALLREPPKRRLRHFLRDSTTHETLADDEGAKPIADFFPNCTVLFADIAGFTAWSSEREPSQVFMLLQNVYQSFDKAARKRNVFKVETIGDSYVAVTGLPDPQADHALIMAVFAVECRARMREVTRRLERTLGPETSSLSMRFGIHSGPVTAGVLVGERSRFQLFGDTVNTAARMESTGIRNFIQVSEATACLLIEAGKGHWVSPRDDMVSVKGKGMMHTFWLETRETFSHRTAGRSDSFRGSISCDSTIFTRVSGDADDVSFAHDFPEIAVPGPGMLRQQTSMIWGTSEVFEDMPPPLRRQSSDPGTRLIDWNVDILSRLLKQVMARRRAVGADQRPFHPESKVEYTSALEEITEIIALPNFDLQATRHVDPESIELDDEVVAQLREYVTGIASMYRDNPFHNFEHACHVELSMCKLLERVVTPDDINYDGGSEMVASDAHEYTYGITSDPLTQFAVVFCALIHDVDHTGVPNGQLVKECAPVAEFYNNKSVAEQNSIDLAWDLLMDSNFDKLRSCIYTNESEYKRFRQLVVNVVLATDIFDKELSALRKNRWNRAFSEESLVEPPMANANRKATIVIEHLIQASDVSHTMQHWEIYRKWNERLFFEMYVAFQSGRTTTDPSTGWYHGELWFFDNYVIPLAKKLKDCGVFGVSSDECLNYALENRRLWADKGEEIVQELLATDYLGRSRKERKSKRSRRRLKQKNSLS